MPTTTVWSLLFLRTVKYFNDNLLNATFLLLSDVTAYFLYFDVTSRQTRGQHRKKAKTDNDAIPSEIGGLKNRPEATNLLSIYASINNVDLSKVLKEFANKNFSTFKSKLSESVVEKICPIGKEIKKLLKDENYLAGVLEKGAKKADLIANRNLKEIYEIIGLTKFT